MARLQRKKTASDKKKKKNTAGATSVALKDNDGAKQTAITAAPGKDVAKKQAISQKKALVKAREEPGKIQGTFNKSIQFLREVKVELKKVTWPTRKQTMGSTVVVIILVIIIALFLGVVDLGLSSLVRVVLQ